MTKEQMAGQPLAWLQNYRNQLVAKRVRLAEEDEEARSPIGRRIHGRLQNFLGAIRDDYAKIDVTKPASEVVIALTAVQVKEAYTRSEIARLSGTQNAIEVLDEELKLCDSMISAKEKQASQSR